MYWVERIPYHIKKKYNMSKSISKSNQTFINQFKIFSDRWFVQIKQSLNSNLDGFISDSGFMGEFLASLITGKKGTASAGSGFDLSDGDRADESKLAVWVRAKICNGCGEKVLFFKPKCECNSKDFTYPSDSRFGIDSKAGIEYKKILQYYVLQIIRPAEYNSNNRKFIYEAFLVDADNKFFSEYLLNQLMVSKKSNNCNLLPYSYDFYRAQPKKVVELEIDVNEVGSEIDVKYFNLKNTQPEQMDLNVVESKALNAICEKFGMSSKRKALLPKEILIENISKLVKLNKLDLTDMKLFPLKKKNLNKERGITSRHL